MSFLRHVLPGLAAGFLTVAVLPEPVLFPHVGHDHASSTGERWACPMMDFIGSHAGTCPVCGMDLQRITAGELTREQIRRMGVQLAEVREGPALATIRASGIVDYDNRSTQLVVPRVAGRIVKRHAATYGCCTDVAAGEPVVDLYSPEVFQAQGELQAALRLGDQRLIDSINARFVRWNLAPVAADIRAGKAPTDTVTITTPVAGQVLLQDFSMADDALMVGKEIAADTPLLKLVDPGKLVLIVQVPESRAAFLREGQSADLSSDDRGRLPEVQAKVARVANEINPELRTREVRIYITGTRQLVKPGSLITASIRAALGPDLLPADPGLESSWGRFALVPKSAVLSTGVRDVAWRLDKTDEKGRQSFAIAPLWLGPRLADAQGQDVFVVRSGLKPGDRVATQGAYLIDAQAQLAGTASLLYPTGTP